MKNTHYITLTVCVVTLAIVMLGCKRKTATEVVPAVELNTTTVTTFAQDIANGIVNGRAEALDKVIDHDHIRQLVSESSIVYSGFDVEGGQAYFDHRLKLGETFVKTVNEGGDFTFTRHYIEGETHQIVFRTYDNFTVNFYDFTVDTVQGQLLLQDAFIYNEGCLLSKSIEGSMLYNLMLITNPEDDVQWLLQAEELVRDHQSVKAIALLREHKETLKSYPIYYPLYIASLYQNDKKHFLKNLETLQEEVDSRTLGLHKLLYCINEGEVETCEQIITQLIPHTGDDPIFLFLYGYAQLTAHHYQDALTCFQTVDKSMPLLWDLWDCELQCYREIDDQAGFAQCLQRGKAAYGLSDKELQEIASSNS